MYKDSSFKIIDNETAEFEIAPDKDFKILQITDTHLGFGPFHKNRDRLAMAAIRKVVSKANPDLIVFTGDMIFPLWPKSGTMNNKKEAYMFIRFADTLGIPYACVFGNHDNEFGTRTSRHDLVTIFQKGKNAIMLHGPKDVYGECNYFINLRRNGVIETSIVMLDSNMYTGKLFWSGFDYIHSDQTDWVLNKLAGYKKENPALQAVAYFHMPVPEFKEAYSRLKMGDESVKYHFGSVGEKNDYFGISEHKTDFFRRAAADGTIKAMSCGHDHLNTISLTYKGIRLIYGMSIDYCAYNRVLRKYTQRGGTLTTVCSDGELKYQLVPLNHIVSSRISGADNEPQKISMKIYRKTRYLL